MSSPGISRRAFMVKSSSCAAATVSAPYFFQCGPAWAAEDRSPNDRPCVGAIGLGGRGGTIAQQAAQFGEIVARCDVDVQHLGAEPNGKTHFTDYRKLLERNDIDVVTIGTPDHWHVKIAIDAMHAGKDVYCEKPLTLTIDEGKLITKAVQQTGRVGQLQRVIASMDGGQTGGPFAQAPAPPHLNWDM